jgi:hypothetical protein
MRMKKAVIELYKYVLRMKGKLSLTQLTIALTIRVIFIAKENNPS